MKEIIKCDRNKKEKRMRMKKRNENEKKSLCVESILEENKYIKH